MDIRFENLDGLNWLWIVAAVIVAARAGQRRVRLATPLDNVLIMWIVWW